MSLQHFRLTTLLLALVCFAMPWFQFRCDFLPDGGQMLVEQSGLQAAYGGTTTFVNGRVVEEGTPIPQGRDPEPAWLLTVFGSTLLLALLASQWMKRGNRRWLTVTLLSGIAAGTLIAQIARGFPMLKDLPEDQVDFTPWYWIALASSIAAPIASLCERVRFKSDDGPNNDPTVETSAWGE